MSNSLNVEINTFMRCAELGVICGIIFDFFKAWRYGKVINRIAIIIHDLIYFAIITFIIFNTIFYTNGAQLRFYMPVALLIFFVLYRAFLSSKILIVLVTIKSLISRLIKAVVKIFVFPIMKVLRLLICPFLAIKRKLLRKKVKFALTFSKICFKIKCNVGMIFKGKKFCKERKPCRRKRKPEKRV